MTRGLVLGKFAPLHRGHQLLIERSLAVCDETVVLVYDSPEVTRIPLSVRAGWVRTLYPRAVVVEGKGAPSASGHDPRIMRLQEDYIHSVVPLPVTHFFSSEWYGAHASRSLGAVDIRVDEARTTVPVSGSLLRSDPFAYRQMVSPVVYRDLVRWVVLLGAESTGKSTLTEALARSLGTVGVAEFGREFWEEHHDAEGKLTAQQLVELATEHRRREDEAVLNANRVMFVDTDARTTRQYGRWYHGGRVAPALEALAQEARCRYHLVVLCGDDIPFADDGTRAGAARRAAAQAEIRAELTASGVDWIEAVGPVSQRAAAVRAALETRDLLAWC